MYQSKSTVLPQIYFFTLVVLLISVAYSRPNDHFNEMGHLLLKNKLDGRNAVFETESWSPGHLVFDDGHYSFLQTRSTQSKEAPPAKRHQNLYGSVRFLPYKKRTIPLELQKALYAHGIVGRRR